MQSEKGEGGKGKGGAAAAAVKGEFSMEWQIQFVKAEQLIQKHLNHPKLRCLLFALLINKVFVGENVISSDHIRHASIFCCLSKHCGLIPLRSLIGLIT